jgi:hypothetical protein
MVYIAGNVNAALSHKSFFVNGNPTLVGRVEPMWVQW